MAAGLAAWGITTSEQLIKVLKRSDASADPLPNGAPPVPKIDILTGAWADAVVYVPKKAELLLDCALDLVLGSAKPGRGHTRLAHHLDPAYWHLLAALVGALPAPTRAEQLHAMVSKHNLFVLVSAVLQARDGVVWAAAVPVLEQLLPTAIRRVAASQVEVVNACFRELLEALPALCAGQMDAMSKLLDMMMVPWLPALELGTNAKKTSKSFLAESLLAYAEAHVFVIEAAPGTPLDGSLRALAAHSLFGPTVLGGRTAHALPDMADIVTAALVEHMRGEHRSAALLIAPQVVDQLVASLRPPRADGTDKTQALPTALRQALLERVLVPLGASMIERPLDFVAARARLELVRCIERSALYQPGGEDQDAWSILWSRLTTSTVSFLEAAGDGAPIPIAIATLTALWDADKDLFMPSLTQSLALAATVDTATAYDFLHRVLAHFAATRHMPRLLEVLRVVCAVVCRADRDAPVRLARSPLLCARATALLERHLRDATTPLQAAPMLADALADAQAHADAGDAPMLVCSVHLLALAVRAVRGALPDDDGALRLATRCIELGARAVSEGDAAAQRPLAAGLHLCCALGRRTDAAVPWHAATETHVAADVRAEVVRWCLFSNHSSAPRWPRPRYVACCVCRSTCSMRALVTSARARRGTARRWVCRTRRWCL